MFVSLAVRRCSFTENSNIIASEVNIRPNVQLVSVSCVAVLRAVMHTAVPTKTVFEYLYSHFFREDLTCESSVSVMQFKLFGKVSSLSAK
jgi:hypothetical protein